MSNIVNICMILDDNYVMPTCVTLHSIIDNKKNDTVLKVYLLCESLNKEHTNLFNSFSSSTVLVNVINAELGNLANLHHPSKKSFCVATKAALLKFKIADLIKEDKILYLDGDLIIRSDLYGLYNTDIVKYYAACVCDSGSIYSENPFVKKFKNYFNSGVMLLNLKRMRKDNISERLIEIKKQEQTSTLMDQHVFNEVFNNEIKTLNIEYNLLIVNLIRSSHKFTIEQLNSKYKTNYRSLNDLEQKSKIIHFSSKDKPWKYYNIPLASEWYREYLKTCLFLDKPASLQRTESELEKNNRFFQEKDRPDIVVSMTSFPARIKFTHIALEDIFSQTLKPDHIVLYLSKIQFPNLEKDLPETLLSLVHKGLIIKWCDDDLKAHKKYFYALQDYPDDILITVDDDLHYSRYMIERLMNSYRKFPRAVSASRVHLMIATYNNNKKIIAPYKSWKMEYTKYLHQPSMQLFPTCGAGTLFPPYCFKNEIFNLTEIKSSCLDADDVWLKINLTLSNIPVVLADIHQRLNYIEGTQNVSLYKTNVNENGNDYQLNKLIEKYNNINKSQSLITKIFQAAPYPNLELKKAALNLNESSSSNDSQKFDSVLNGYITSIVELQNEIINNKDKIISLTQRINKLKSSLSWRIGRLITYFPRVVIKLFR